MTRLAAAVVGAGWLAGRRYAPSASLPTEDDEPEDGEADVPSARTAERTPPREGAFSRRGVVAGDFAPREAWYPHAAAAFPAAYACYVAASRIVDYKHRPADVVAGALVGLAAAAACDGGVSIGAFPSSGVGRKRGGGGSAREDETRLTSPGLVDSRI